MNSDKLSLNSETCKKRYEKNIGRNPLADICQNDNVVNIRKITRSQSTVKTLKTLEEKKTRTSSASEVKYAFKSENITQRRSTNQVVYNSDEVFIEGEKHYLNYVSESKQLSCIQNKITSREVEPKITQPLPVVRVTAATSERPEVKKPTKPAKKVTLVRKLSSRSKSARIQEFYRDCLYDTDYFEDNYHYMLVREKKFVYRKSFLQKYADENYRMIVINWLIYTQQVLDLSEHAFFVAIRMFDCLLVSTKISCSRYTLIAIICMWIANKQLDIQYMLVPKIFALCNSKYSRDQIISIEKEILRALEFNVNFPEPATFLYYYLHQEKLENNSTIRNSAMFLLECFTLLIDFSSMTPSLLASLALYLVMVKYNVERTSFLEHVDSYVLDKRIFIHKSEEMDHSVKQLLKCKCVTDELVAKYSVEHRCNVAQTFISE